MSTVNHSWRAYTVVIVGPLICWMLSATGLMAEGSAEGSRVLVVVADARDAECAERIGGRHVKVERLFPPASDMTAVNYDACSTHVHRLRAFTLYLARFDLDLPSEPFWRERLTNTNPQGQVHWISSRRCKIESDGERRARQAIAIHRGLLEVLPQQRAYLESNLRAELIRVQTLRLQPAHLVSSD